ncbi:MAG: hypothetical protein M0Q22_09100 [Sulfuritalea sp.]|jgi:hypothetical protein|nr:hypothetical protein [Sulfuritalea sp.]
MVMIHSSEFQGLSVADRYFSLARGYLEGSRVLCEAIDKDDYAPQYSHTRVVLHLCRHAVELFLKGAIAYATNAQPLQTHHLGNLITEYERVLPDPMFLIEIPFGVDASGTPDFFDDRADQLHKTLDQRYRYPTDRSGNVFSEPEGFIAPMFMSDLEGLSKAFLQVELRLKKEAS